MQREQLLNGYLTIEELATELNVSVRTIYRWNCERCGPPQTRVGIRSLYRRTAVVDWLESRERSQVRAERHGAGGGRYGTTTN